MRRTGSRSSRRCGRRSSERRACSRPGRPRATSICPPPGVGRALPQPHSRRDLPADRRGEPRRTREQEIDRARDAFYEGFVAEEIDRFVRAEDGLLTGDDLAAWEPSFEPPAHVRVPRAHRLQDGHLGLRPCRAPAARAARGLRPRRALPGRARPRRHRVREARIRRPRRAVRRDAEVRLDILLSDDILERAARARRRGRVGGVPPGVRTAAAAPRGRGDRRAPASRAGDTVHLDIADRHGNMVSATPSGGWLQSSPVIGSLGWPLGTRAQMFWLEDGPALVAPPGARPRTTLSPGLALRNGEPYLAWGTPGGDKQEQWALHAFLRHVDLGLNLQEAIDAPEFDTDHLISSFYPARLRAEVALARVPRLLAYGRRSPAARARRPALAALVARSRDRRRPRAGRAAPGGRERTRDAGLRRRPVASRLRGGRAHSHVLVGRSVGAARRDGRALGPRADAADGGGRDLTAADRADARLPARRGGARAGASSSASPPSSTTTRSGSSTPGSR